MLDKADRFEKGEEGLSGRETVNLPAPHRHNNVVSA